MMLILKQQKAQTNLACLNNTQGVFVVLKINDEEINENYFQLFFWLLLANQFNKNTFYGQFDYIYDKTYRLTNAIQPSPLTNRSYSYDAVGNRIATEIENESWSYNADHQLLSYGTPNNQTIFVYDDNGNTISKTDKDGVEEYIYNVANRLSEVKRDGAIVASYYYDPFGRRLWKEVAGVKTYFLYASEGLIAEYEGAGTLIQSYQYMPGSQFGTAALSMIKNGEASFYQHDQIGTPNLLTSKTGQVKWQGAIDAFGQMVSTTSNVNSPLRFAGQYQDNETGYHQNYFRDYNSRTGRYLQSDPFGLAGGMNTYGYVLANPIKHIDPYGLWPTIGVDVHTLITRLSTDLGEDELAVLEASTLYSDAYPFQESQYSYRHAMRNADKNQTACEAKAMADKFIRNQFQRAWFAKKQGNMEAALFEFGQALHTLQDSTSPDHFGFQPWSDNYKWYGRAGVHGVHEALFFDIGSMIRNVAITKAAFKWFDEGPDSLPDDFFANHRVECLPCEQ